jgi:hypothetical protein
MADALVWIVALLFYAPFHYLGPVLVVLFTGREQDTARRRRLLKLIAMDCSLSMVAAFALAWWLSAYNLMWAMLILLVSMAVPYLHLLLWRRFAK